MHFFIQIDLGLVLINSTVVAKRHFEVFSVYISHIYSPKLVINGHPQLMLKEATQVEAPVCFRH